MADIRTLDLNLLKGFSALMQEQSVTRAASRLSLTQPAVSNILVRLRDSFDDPLFIRTSHGMVPTPRAEALAGPIALILGEIEGLLQPQTFDPSVSEIALSIASTDYALRAVIVPFLTRIKLLAPRLKVAVRPVANQLLAQQLEQGDIDLAIVTPESVSPDLHARRLFDEEYVCMLREGHPAANGTLTLPRFCELEHALVSYEGEIFSGVTDSALAAKGMTRNVTLSVSSFLILPEILRCSELIAVVPRRLAINTRGVTLLPPPLAIPGFTKMVAWHERTHASPAHRWLRQQLFNTFTDPQP